MKLIDLTCNTDHLRTWCNCQVGSAIKEENAALREDVKALRLRLAKGIKFKRFIVSEWDKHTVGTKTEHLSVEESIDYVNGLREQQRKILYLIGLELEIVEDDAWGAVERNKRYWDDYVKKLKEKNAALLGLVEQLGGHINVMLGVMSSEYRNNPVIKAEDLLRRAREILQDEVQTKKGE